MNLKLYDKDIFQAESPILVPNVNLNTVSLSLQLKFEDYTVEALLHKDTRNYEEKISRYSFMIFLIGMLSFYGLLNIIKAVFQNEAEGTKVNF